MFVPARVPEFKLEPAHWEWIPWCTQKSTFGGLTPDEKKEQELHKKHQCTGRDFVKESDDAVKEFEQRAHWNRAVKHDPVQDMEVD